MANWYSEHYKEKNRQKKEDKGDFFIKSNNLIPTVSALTFLKGEDLPRITKKDVIKSKEYIVANIVGLFAFILTKILTTQSLSFWSWPLSFAVGLFVLFTMIWILER